MVKKFDDFDVRLMNARLLAQATNTPEDRENAKQLCVEFKNWCVMKRNGIVSDLRDNPGSFGVAAMWPTWRAFCDDDLTPRIRQLAECDDLHPAK